MGGSKKTGKDRRSRRGDRSVHPEEEDEFRFRERKDEGNNWGVTIDPEILEGKSGRKRIGYLTRLQRVWVQERTGTWGGMGESQTRRVKSRFERPLHLT